MGRTKPFGAIPSVFHPKQAIRAFN